MGDAYITRRGGGGGSAAEFPDTVKLQAKVKGEYVNTGDVRVLGAGEDAMMSYGSPVFTNATTGQALVSTIVPGTTDEVFVVVPTRYYDNMYFDAEAIMYARCRIEKNTYTPLTDWATVDFLNNYVSIPFVTFASTTSVPSHSSPEAIDLSLRQFSTDWAGVIALDDRHFALCLIQSSYPCVYLFGWKADGNPWWYEKVLGFSGALRPTQVILFNKENSSALVAFNKKQFCTGVATISADDKVTIINTALPTSAITNVGGAAPNVTDVYSIDISKRKFRTLDTIFVLNETYSAIVTAKKINTDAVLEGVVKKSKYLYGLDGKSILNPKSIYAPFNLSYFDNRGSMVNCILPLNVELNAYIIPGLGYTYVGEDATYQSAYAKCFYTIIDWSNDENPQLIDEGFLPVNLTDAYTAFRFCAWNICGNNLYISSAKLLANRPSRCGVIMYTPTSTERPTSILGVIDIVLYDMQKNKLSSFPPTTFIKPKNTTSNFNAAFSCITSGYTWLVITEDVIFVSVHQVEEENGTMTALDYATKVALKVSNMHYTALDNTYTAGYTLPFPRAIATSSGGDGDLIDMQMIFD